MAAEGGGGGGKGFSGQCASRSSAVNGRQGRTAEKEGRELRNEVLYALATTTSIWLTGFTALGLLPRITCRGTWATCRLSSAIVGPSRTLYCAAREKQGRSNEAQPWEGHQQGGQVAPPKLFQNSLQLHDCTCHGHPAAIFAALGLTRSVVTV